MLTYLRITFRLKLSGPSPLTRAYCRAVNCLLSTKILKLFHVRFWFYFILQETPDQLLHPHTHSLSTCKSKSQGGWGCSQGRAAGAFPILLLGNPIHCSYCKETHRNTQTKPSHDSQLPCFSFPLQMRDLQVNYLYGQSHSLS